jgi:hypothetical protein
MKYIYIVLFVFFKFLGYSQIPYATQQPKWCFPIYTKDASGRKDTVYIGDDPHAQNGNASNPAYNDINFGEKWIIPSFPNAFNIATYYWISPTDSLMKVDIENYTISQQLHYSLTMNNVILPVSFYWDLSKLRSDSLPFPNQSPAPRAQIEVTFLTGNYSVGGNHGLYCNISIPTVVSDSIVNPPCMCYTKDSLQLLDPNNSSSPQTFVLGFDVVPWSGQQSAGIREEKKQDFKIFPNPVNSILKILSPNNDKYRISIFNSIGQNIMELNFEHLFSFDFTTLNNGIYLVKIFDSKGDIVANKKIIKQ